MIRSRTSLVSLALLLIFGVTISELSLSQSTVLAQEAGRDTVFTAPVETNKQQELAVLYQSLIEDYGTKARVFSLNRAQWQSLQTLRSLEEAVTATTAVLVARDKTMITYFELLLGVLEKTPGIELTLKQQSKDALTARIQWLQLHEQQSLQSVDRDSVNARSDEYRQASDLIGTEAQYALMLVRLGQLQTTFDRANGLYGRILERNKSNPSTPTQEIERERAYTQVGILKDSIQSDLTLARNSLDPQTAERGKIEESYASFISRLESPYSKTYKYLSYLEELALDTW